MVELIGGLGGVAAAVPDGGAPAVCALPGLDHKILLHPGDGKTVIKALPGQRSEVLHRLRGFVGEKHGLKDAHRGVEHRDGVPRRRVGELQLCRLHRRAADALS